MVYWHRSDQAHLVTGDHEASVVVLVGDVEVGLVLAQVAHNVQPALRVCGKSYARENLKASNNALGNNLVRIKPQSRPPSVVLSWSW